MLGADARLAFQGLYLNAEYVRVEEEAGGPKTTSAGQFPLSSAFWARGGYVQLAYGLPIGSGTCRSKVTVYGRYDRRHAWFEGFTPITVERFTGGVRLDFWESVILKGEYLVNRERRGHRRSTTTWSPTSLVYSW